MVDNAASIINETWIIMSRISIDTRTVLDEPFDLIVQRLASHLERQARAPCRRSMTPITTVLPPLGPSPLLPFAAVGVEARFLPPT
jgi:hypothetical protein